MLMNLIRGQLTFESAVIQIFAILVVIFLVLPFHEWAHAYTALRLGDTSVRYRGRLTLNPMAHFDPIGALALLLFGVGWAKPVPINTRSFKNPKLYMGITALMGPVANVVAAIAGGLILNALVVFAPDFLIDKSFGYYVLLFLSFYVDVNCSLAVFNLLPIPPLDGSKILFIFLPDKAVEWFYRYERYISMGLLLLIWTDVLDVPLGFLIGGLESFVYWLTGLPFGIF